MVPFLYHIPPFASLDIKRLLEISGYIVTLTVDRGELVTFEGHPVEAFYVIAAGSFQRFKTSRKGREQILYLLRRGDSFGEVALLDGGDDFASTRALEPGTLYALPRSWFTLLLDEYPDFNHALSLFLAARVRHMVDLVADLSFRSILERVAKLLLEQSLDPAQARLTQSDMARMTGTIREVAARALNELEIRGVIAIQRGDVSIRDPVALHRIVEGEEPAWQM